VTGRIPPRRPYQGLVQILDYNRPIYLCTASGAMVALALSVYVPTPVRWLIMLATAGAVFWTCSSLLVSHYVYDRSGLYGLSWLHRCLTQPPRRWINIHAGIDESSLAISSMFPESEAEVVDIYDPRKMTESSIKRARRAAGLPSPSAHPEGLPAPDEHFDAVFLIFAAHELRHHQDRAQLFREVTRVLCGRGELVLVEHLRNCANFLAFGPGFLHFSSKRTWKRAANSAGLHIRLHTTVTPFVHVFVLRKQR
jgi:hypothetical protein